MNNSISVIGGDLRQLTLAELLSRDGYDVTVSGFKSDGISGRVGFENDIKTASKADILILPMPVVQNNMYLNAPFSDKLIPISEIADNAKPSALILGGRIGKDTYELFEKQKCIDYYEREELMIKNAVPTAEGAIEIAIEETPVTIAKSKCLIIGYGRIGKVLARLMKSMGADVTVSARRYSDLAWIDVNGCRAVHNKDIADGIDTYDVIFNTAPALILGESVLSKINPDSIVIDLASKPGGVDFQKAKDLGLKVIWALSLPRKAIS